jgi:hypothetical protein
MNTDRHGYLASPPSVFIRVHPWFRWISHAFALGRSLFLAGRDEQEMSRKSLDPCLMV